MRNGARDEGSQRSRGESRGQQAAARSPASPEPFFACFGETLEASSTRDLAAKLSMVGDRVPRRTKGQRHWHRERYCTVAFLRALSSLKSLSFPLRIAKGQRPDLMLSGASGATIGVEISTIATSAHQEAATVLERRGRGWALEGEKRLVPPGGELREPPWHGDDPERAFAKLFWKAVEPKVEDLNEPDYASADTYWLLLYDNSHLLPLFSLETVGPYLDRGDSPSAERLFDRIDVLRDSALLVDALGDRTVVQRTSDRRWRLGPPRRRR